MTGLGHFIAESYLESGRGAGLRRSESAPVRWKALERCDS